MLHREADRRGEGRRVAVEPHRRVVVRDLDRRAAPAAAPDPCRSPSAGPLAEAPASAVPPPDRCRAPPARCAGWRHARARLCRPFHPAAGPDARSGPADADRAASRPALRPLPVPALFRSRPAAARQQAARRRRDRRRTRRGLALQSADRHVRGDDRAADPSAGGADHRRDPLAQPPARSLHQGSALRCRVRRGAAAGRRGALRHLLAKCLQRPRLPGAARDQVRGRRSRRGHGGRGLLRPRLRQHRGAV